MITSPRQYLSNENQEFTYFLVRIPNPKEGYADYYLHTTAKKNIGKNLFKLYCKGDYLIIKGQLIIKQSENKKIKIELSVMKDYPVMLDS